MQDTYIECCGRYPVGSAIALWAVEVISAYKKLIDRESFQGFDDDSPEAAAYRLYGKFSEHGEPWVTATAQEDWLEISSDESVDLDFCFHFLSELSVKSGKIISLTYSERTVPNYPEGFSGGAIIATPNGETMYLNATDWVREKLVNLAKK